MKNCFELKTKTEAVLEKGYYTVQSYVKGSCFV